MPHHNIRRSGSAIMAGLSMLIITSVGCGAAEKVGPAKSSRFQARTSKEWF